VRQPEKAWMAGLCRIERWQDCHHHQRGGICLCLLGMIPGIDTSYLALGISRPKKLTTFGSYGQQTESGRRLKVPTTRIENCSNASSAKYFALWSPCGADISGKASINSSLSWLTAFRHARILGRKDIGIATRYAHVSDKRGCGLRSPLNDC
jgi:hypothetical protein